MFVFASSLKLQASISVHPYSLHRLNCDSREYHQVSAKLSCQLVLNYYYYLNLSINVDPHPALDGQQFKSLSLQIIFISYLIYNTIMWIPKRRCSFEFIKHECGINAYTTSRSRISCQNQVFPKLIDIRNVKQLLLSCG